MKNEQLCTDIFGKSTVDTEQAECFFGVARFVSADAFTNLFFDVKGRKRNRQAFQKSAERINLIVPGFVEHKLETVTAE